MRGAQGNLVVVDPVLFYQLMTAHGVGMVGAAGLSGAAIMWYFLGRHVSLSERSFSIFLAPVPSRRRSDPWGDFRRRLRRGLDFPIPIAGPFWRCLGQ